MKKLLVIVFFTGIFSLPLVAQDSLRTDIPAEFNQVVVRATYDNVELKDALKTLAFSTNANIYLNPVLTGIRISVRLNNQRLIDILEFITKQYDLQITWFGNIAQINPKPRVEPPPPLPRVANIYFSENQLLSIDAQQVSTDSFLRQLTQKTGKNFISESPLPENLTGYIKDVNLTEAVKLFFRSNNITANEKSGVFYLRRNDSFQQPTASGQPGKQGSYWYETKDSLITIDVLNAPIDRLIKDVAQQLGISIIFYSDLTGTISAKASRLTIDQFFSILLRNTNFAYKQEGSIYFIGDSKSKSLSTTKLIWLKNRKVENVQEIIPESLTSGLSIKTVKEQNGILVTGSQNAINDIQFFINSIDFSTPQVLIEALAIDFSLSDNISTGVSAGRRLIDTSGTASSDSWLPGIDITLSSKDLNNMTQGLPEVNVLGTSVNLARIGKLPPDFYLKIKALENAGVAKVRSRPMLSTLNGNKASLNVGTTQYFLLKSTTPVPGNNTNPLITESQKFEKIVANISLEITPWVSTSGEVTVEIHPKFETPIGQFSSEVPPTINTRELNSTIRLSDGETIVLGGLIEESEGETTEGIPYISRIPYIGTFFSNKTKTKRKSELVIYVTPRVYLGNGQQPELSESDLERLKKE